jgi:hypothetical protein
MRRLGRLPLSRRSRTSKDTSVSDGHTSDVTENDVPLAAGMVALGHGSYVRADRVFAVIPIDGPERGNGRRTYVHVEYLAGPLVASRSERAILAELQQALVEETPQPPRRWLLRRGAHRPAVRSS